MTHKKLHSVLATTFLLLIIHIAKADQNTTSTETLVKKAIADFMYKNHVPGVAVELYVNGKPYFYNFGYANRDEKKPVTQKTIFEIGSITKLFTSLLLAEQVNAGNLQLNAPITRYLPELPARFSQVTLQDLATHTAGLPVNAPEKITDQSALITFLADGSLSATPGTQWNYSNLGMGLLGYALEHATQQSTDQLYIQNILVPLHMQAIGLAVPKKLQAQYAQGYDKDGNNAPCCQLKLLPAAWGMEASAHDMLLFLHAAIDLPGTPKNIAQAMRITQTPYVLLPNMQQGLGWQIHSLNYHTLEDLQFAPLTMDTGPLPATTLPRNKRLFTRNALLDKTGATFGFRSYIAVIPAKQSGIVILANHYVSNGAIVNLGRYILLQTARII
jgi:beta-lactamase class C